MYIFQKRKLIAAKRKTKLRVKTDFLLISKLLMTCQTREVDHESLFSHENNTYPPAISSNGYLNVPGSKSDILKKLEHGLISTSELPTSVDTRVLMDRVSCTR